VPLEMPLLIVRQNLSEDIPGIMPAMPATDNHTGHFEVSFVVSVCHVLFSGFPGSIDIRDFKASKRGRALHVSY